SVYFKKLDEVKAETLGSFDAEAYTEELWKEKLIPSLDQAVQLDSLLLLLKQQPDEAFAKYSNALGIGNIKYFMVQGNGEVLSVDENTVAVKLADNPQAVRIATEYIYGNEIRDASGLIPMTEFKNTMDFNNVSAALNKKVRTEVMPPFKKRVTKGTKLKFYGAIELNQKYLDLNAIEIIPVK